MYEGHTNEVLTPPFQRYELFGAAAPFMAPRINVPSSRIRTRTKGRISMTAYTGEATDHTSRAGRIRFNYSDTAIVLTPYRLAGEVADDERNDSAGIEGNLDLDTAEAVATGLNLGWELRVHKLATDFSKYTNTKLDLGITGEAGKSGRALAGWSHQLGHKDSNLRAMIMYGQQQIAKHGGVMADRILIPPTLLPDIEDNEIFRDVLKRHQLGGVNETVLSNYLSGQGMMFPPENIMIPWVTINTETEEDAKYDFIWNDDYIILFASAKPGQSSQSPFFASTLTFEGTPVVSSRRASDFDGDIHEGRFWQKEHIYHYDRAFAITNLRGTD